MKSPPSPAEQIIHLEALVEGLEGQIVKKQRRIWELEDEARVLQKKTWETPGNQAPQSSKEIL